MTTLTHNSVLCIYFNSLNFSSNLVLIIRRINCINTTSGICHPVSVTVSCAGRNCTRNGHRHRVTYTRGCIDTIDSPDDFYIFVNCDWVVTRWQQYSTHLHTNSTQNDTKQTIHRTTQQFGRVRAVSPLG